MGVVDGDGMKRCGVDNKPDIKGRLCGGWRG